MGTGGKAAEAWRWPTTPSKVEVKERVELYLYSPLGLRGLFWVKFTFTLLKPTKYFGLKRVNQNAPRMSRYVYTAIATIRPPMTVWWSTSLVKTRWSSGSFTSRRMRNDVKFIVHFERPCSLHIHDLRPEPTFETLALHTSLHGEHTASAWTITTGREYHMKVFVSVSDTHQNQGGSNQYAWV